jgi:metal-sulfur cluster biosynthetic enzyme
MSLKDKVIEALKKVQDPELKQDVVSLKLVYDFDIDEENGIVKFKFMPTTPDCPIGVQLALMIRGAVKEVPGVKKVQLRVEQFIYQDQLNTYLEEIEKEEEQGEHIAIAADKNGNVWTGECNKAEFFMIYTKYGNFISARENSLIKDGLIDNIIKFVNLLADIKTLICKKIEPEFKEKLEQHYGLNVFITTKSTQKEALAEFFNRDK